MRRRNPLAPLLALLVITGTIPTVHADEPPAPAERVLQFPEDQSVGVVMTRPPIDGSYAMNWGGDWTTVGEARGEVTVPAGVVVRLDVNEAASSDLSFLGDLRPNDIQVLLAGNANVRDEGLKYIGRMTGLRVLLLNDTRITDASIRHLSGLKKLQEIRLGAYEIHEKGFGIGDEAMTVLAGLPELEFINLRLTRVSDEGLKALAKCKSLTALDVPGTKITDAGLAYLKELPNLTHLRLGHEQEGTAITDKGLRVIGQMTNLTSLDLSGTTVTNDGLVHLKTLKNLEKLTIDGTQVTEDGLVHLASLDSLKSLRFYGHRVTDKGAAHLAKLESLRSIRSNLAITDKGVAWLADLPHLESLNLSGTGVTDAAIPHIAQMASLKDLSFERCAITDDGLKPLSKLKTLEELTLYRTSIAGDGLRILQELPKLKRLHLNFDSQFELRVSGLPHLRYVGSISSLESLNLSGARLKDDDLADLRGLPHLKSLTIYDMVLGNQAAMQIGKLTTLSKLSVDKGVISDNGLDHLADLSNVESLRLDGQFTDQGLCSLKSLKSLRWVRLSSPYITDDGLRSLAKALPLVGTAERLPLFGISHRQGDTFRRQGTEDERTNRNSLEQNPPPPLFLTNWINCDDEDLTPEDLRGKVVLIDFWGTWCGACKVEMPKLKRLHKEHQDEGLVIVGIHTTDGSENMEKYVAEKEISWPVAVDVKEQTVDAWHVASYPGYYLIDRRGRLRVADIFNADVERAVLELLEEESPEPVADSSGQRPDDNDKSQ